MQLSTIVTSYSLNRFITVLVLITQHSITLSVRIYTVFEIIFG